VTQVFTWRTVDKLGLPTIAARLNTDPVSYPPPTAGIAWTAPALFHILTNPKYTGYMVLGRRRKTGGRLRPVQPSEWLWSPEPTHAALVDRETWDAAQTVGAERGNVRDAEAPAGRPGRRYVLRSRIRCRTCKRRMRGATHVHHPGNGVTYAYTYYRCPHTEANPNHAATHPDHPYTAVREDALMSALATFFTERVFGPDRAAMLAAQLPQDAAEQDRRRDAQAAALRKQLARIEVAENALLSELETPADPGDKAAQALRNRIRVRFKDLYEQRTGIEAQLAALQAPAERDDPALLDELPTLGDILADAPPRLTEQLFEAFGIQAVYNKDLHQVTIHATLTDATPQAIADLVADPRADHNQPPAPATEQDHLRHSGKNTPVREMAPSACLARSGSASRANAAPSACTTMTLTLCVITSCMSRAIRARSAAAAICAWASRSRSRRAARSSSEA
jgi:site-specific DNA recombinase